MVKQDKEQKSSETIPFQSFLRSGLEGDRIINFALIVVNSDKMYIF